MRSKIGQAGSSWLVTAAVVIAGLAFVALLLWTLKEAVEASPEVVISVVAVVGGFATTQWLQRRVERERIRETRRDKLSPHYENLLKFVRSSAKRKGSSGTARDEKFWAALTDNLVLWGSPELIAAWANFMREIEAEGERGDADTFIREYTKVLHAIRGELGHQDSRLAVRDLLRLFMNDADKMVPKDLRF